MSGFLNAVSLVFGSVLLGVGLTVRGLCYVSYREEEPDPVERLLTLVGSGIPGTIGLIMILLAIM